jgi:porphobilinogen synthase
VVLPLSVRPGRKLRRPIKAMPGVFQLSTDELLRDAAAARDAGVPAVLLLGIRTRRMRGRRAPMPGTVSCSGGKPAREF